MRRRDPGPPRGIVESVRGKPFEHLRVGPAGDLARHLRHVWIVAWDLDAPHEQVVLPHPAGHLVLERDRSSVTGIHTGRFVREIAGAGRVVGIALRPGMLPCFTGVAAWESRGRVDPLTTIWPDALELERAALDAASDEERVAIVERWLRARLPAIDPEAERAAAIVEEVERDRTIVRVEQIAERAGLDTRSLQRIFRAWIGVTPKWVIQRYRIHEALERVARDGAARVALELGYSDQAHFARDFKAVVGRTPREHARAVRVSR